MRKVFGTILALLWLFVLCTGAWADNKTPFFAKRQAGGGIVIANQTQTTGNYWFVDSGSANASDAAGYGQNPDAPVATIDYAIGLATASNGDVIVVMPGHAETLTTEGAITADVAGVRILGLGIGRDRPTLTWGGKSAAILVSANDFTFENIVFDMSFATGADTGVSVTGTDFKLLGSEVILSDDSTGKVGHGIYLSGGTRTQISDCQFLGSGLATSAVTEVVFVGSRVDDVNISNVYVAAYVDSGTELYGGAFSGVASAVSGFRMSDSVFMLGNSGSSPFYFDQTTKIDGLVTNTASTGGTLTGVTIIEIFRIQDFPNIAN